MLMLGCKGLSSGGQARKRGCCTPLLHKGWTSHKMVSLSGYKLGFFFWEGEGCGGVLFEVPIHVSLGIF